MKKKIKRLQSVGNGEDGILPKFRGLKSEKLELIPSAEEISKLYQQNAKFVKDFTVKNEFGKVTWEEYVDLTDVRIDEVVQITKCCAAIYEDEGYMPNIGDKLNKDSKVTLYGVKISYNEEQMKLLKELKGKEKFDFHNNIVEGYKKKLKQQLEKSGAELISYKFEEKELCFIHKAKSNKMI